MIKILNSANETLSILQDVSSAEISEEINGAFTFDFMAAIDGTKSAEIYHGHKVEIEDNYFNIMRTVKSRAVDGITISATCEHVSYDFLNVVFTAGFTFTGLASAAFTYLISAVNTALSASFTLGTFTTTANETLTVNEPITAKGVMLDLAALYVGELEFDKYAVSLLTHRGADNGVQFRYRKNISEAAVTVDYQALKDDGSPTVTYEVSAAELEYEQGYIDKGYSALEHYELGDTIHVLDDDLDIDVSARIVKNTYNPLQRMQGTVEIGDYVNDLTDTLTNIKTTTVGKNTIYNGVSIGPDNGFVAERSDAMVKTTMNATDGITIELKASATASYTAVFYVAVDTATNTAKLYLAGDAVFTGAVEASTITASAISGGTIDGTAITGVTIAIGSGNNIFKANTNGISLGSALFASAPFRVTMSGAVTASNLSMTGGDITAANITITADATIGNSLHLGEAGSTALKTMYFNGSAQIGNYLDSSGSPPTGLNISSSSLKLDGVSYIDAPDGMTIYGDVGFNGGDSGTFYATGNQTLTITGGIITQIL